MAKKVLISWLLATLTVVIGMEDSRAAYKTDYMEISREQIETIYTQFIRNKMPWKEEEVRISNIRYGHKIILPKGQLTYEVISPRGCNYSGRVCLSIVFRVNRKHESKVRVTGQIKVLKKVVYTNRPLRRHEVIEPEDIQLVEKDITYLPEQIITDPEEVVGKRTIRSLGTYEVLTKNLVESVPLIRRGDITTILAESENLRVIAKGKARQSGYLGDHIRVLNIGSKKEIYAKVVDESTVKVEF